MNQYFKASLKDQAPMIKRFGKSFQSGAFKWTIVWCKAIESNGEKCCGLCVPKERKIYIDINQDDVEDTLIHEMFHAECYEVGLYTMPSWNSDLEELAAEAASRLCRNFDLRRKHGKPRTKPR